MLNRLFSFLERRRAAGDRRLSDALLRLAEEKGCLLVEPVLLRTLGVDRTRFFRILVALLMGERLFVFSRPDGGMELVANKAFARFTMGRVAAIEPATPLHENTAPGLTASMPDDSQPGDGLCADIDSSLFTGATLGGVCRDGVMALFPELGVDAACGAGHAHTAPRKSAIRNQGRARRQRMPAGPHVVAAADTGGAGKSTTDKKKQILYQSFPKLDR